MKFRDDPFFYGTLGLAMFICLAFLLGTFVAVPIGLYRGDRCAAHCARRNMVCASTAFFSDAFVCAKPGESNINANVEVSND